VVTKPMAIPILLPIIGFAVLAVLVSYVAIRLYRSRGSCLNGLPNHVSSSGKTTSWDWPKSFLWSRPQTRKKAKPFKHISVDLLPITGLPPHPTAVPSTPPSRAQPLVDISSASIPRTPASFYQKINKHIHSLHHTSFPRPLSPHALLATTSPTKLPRRSRSLGGVPVKRLSGGNLRKVQMDMEIQEMNRGTSREHLLIDFSSSGSSDELDALRKENDVTSRRISPPSSDIGILPSHRRPSLFDDAEDVALDLAPGRKVVQLVDLGDVEDGLGPKQKEEDAWKWFAPPLPKIHLTPPFESTPAKPISKSVSEPLPIIPLPLSMSEGKLIDVHSAPEEEPVLIDLDEHNVPQQEQPEFICVHRTRVDLDLVVGKPTVDVEPLDEHPTVRSPLEGRRSLDSLMKPIDTATIPVQVQNPISSSVVKESSQRGRRVDRHPLEEEVPEKVEVGPASTTKTAVDIEDEDQGRRELANEHDNHELYDHHDDYSYAYNIHHDHHSPQSLDTIRGEEFQSSSSSPRAATIPVQAAPAWYWDHEDDPWNGAVGVVNEEEGEREQREVVEERGDERRADVMDVPEMEAGLEVGEDDDTVKTSPGSKVLELPIELEVPIETEDEESYPDPDYLPLPEMLLSHSPVTATEVPLVLVENEPSDNFQEDSEDANENPNDQELHLQFKDEEKSPRRVTAQIPTSPASPLPSPLRVQGLDLGGPRSGLPSPSPTGGLLPLASPSPLSTPLSASPRLAPLLLLTHPDTPSPSVRGDKENAAGVDKENEMPNRTTGRPLWSIRAGDAPAIGLAAGSLSMSTSTSSADLIPGVATSMGVSPRMRRVLGDVTVVVAENGEREEEEVTTKEEKGELMKGEDDEDDESLPGAFPGLLKPTSFSDTNTIVAPTITIAALTSTLLSTSIAAASTSTTTSSSTTSPVIQRRPRQPIVRSPLDIALAMQLRPGLGVGADPAWMVRFLMAMFGWFAILVSGQGEF